MQYFTFLGMGYNDDKYDEALYNFDEEVYASNFVQVPIIEKFNDVINDVFIFCTDESYNRHGDELEKLLKKYNKNIYFIKVKYDVQSEEIIKQMNNYINDDFIIDITHSFRSIPVAVLLITRYLEVSKNKKLLHLYYGKYNKKENVGEIIDLVRLYNESKIVNALESFNNHLKVLPDSLSYYNDDKIVRLFNSFRNFNQMIELCEFDESIKCITSIYNYSKEILKTENEYIMLVPYLNGILNKFKDIQSENKYELKKIMFIKMLLQHDLYQIAITFTDQLFREELIHRFYFPDRNRFEPSLLQEIKLYRNQKLTVYDLSQDLIYELELRKANSRLFKDDIIRIRNRFMDSNRDTSALDIRIIDQFYNEIRNRINHGEKINLSSSTVKSTINSFLLCLEKFVREG